MPRGTVEDFDEAQGYGAVRSDDGRQLFFHCTQITDGSRTIAPGTAVEFDIRTGHRGQWEAADIHRR